MYNFKEIENKWQKYWEDDSTFTASNSSDKEKFYCLIEFPYPSGTGLHVGHVRSYSALDSLARKKRLEGYNVLFPMGFDAFGLPAEEYAIKNKIHPSIAVKECIKIFKGQLKMVGLSFDWSREFATTDPNYYKWTQWQFLKFYEHDMAYKGKKEINWCPHCKIGLANEEIEAGKCERCGGEVEHKEKEQWMLKMKSYAQKLIDGLDDTNFLDKIKLAQINWIGKSSGAEVKFKIKDKGEELTVFTTRPDTLYGATFMVIAPEHPIIDTLKNDILNLKEIKEYKNNANKKSELERTSLNKEKTGVKIEGITAINPVNNVEIPIYISDYVMMNYGTGAIMAVPAHDDRDYAFAKKFNIPIVQVLEEVTGIKNNEETHKDSIVAVVYDSKNDSYLTINWHDKGGRLFVGGTRHNGEDAIVCAKREIIEETGYDDIELMYIGNKINHHYYAYNKDKYFEIESTPLLFKLNSNHQSSKQLDDDEIFDVEWVDKNIIESEINDGLHKKTYEYVTKKGPMINDGIHINSEFLNGLDKEEATTKMISYLEENNLGKKVTNYKLQDWVFSRQRFWGEPIPMIYCEDCGWVPVPYEDLPVVLPNVKDYEPTDNGESPLSKIPDWYNVACPKCGKMAKRETDTMPNWAGSSWYYLRYMDPKNNENFASMDAMKYWKKVDWYNGGMEHATRHLLYARFWHKFLYDIKLVPFDEPFDVRVAHGMVLGENGEKMSKSKGNVINPNDVINEFGADTLRCYEMFMGDYEKEVNWSTNGLKGCKRFLDRVWNLQDKLNENKGYTKELEVMIHKTIKKVSNDIDTMKYNTAVSTLMTLLNEFDKKTTITKDDFRTFLILLNPIAPHITEELNEICKLGDVIAKSNWPIYDENKLVLGEYSIAVQVNGKLRGTINININDTEEELKNKALNDANVIKHINNKEIVKVIVIKGKIVNIVVKM
ncbi:MAG: class I tRNA ligase family protein [Bacilli bacterium]